MARRKREQEFLQALESDNLAGKVCQRLDLEGTDLVRRSTRTILEVSLQAWY